MSDTRQALADRRRKRKSAQESGGEGKRTFVDEEACKRLGITAYKVGKTNLLCIVRHPDDPWSHEINIHYGVGVNNEQFGCPVDLKQRCPSCERFGIIKARHQKEGVEFGDKDAWEELKPFYVNRNYPHHILLVHDLTAFNKGEDKGLQYVLLPESVAGPTGGLVDACYDPRTEDIICDPTNAKTGRDFYFETYEEGGFTKYKNIRLLDRADKQGPIDYSTEVPEWFANVPHFSDFVKYQSYDVFKAALEGAPTGDAPAGNERSVSGASSASTDAPPGDGPRRRLGNVKQQETASADAPPDATEPEPASDTSGTGGTGGTTAATEPPAEPERPRRRRLGGG